MRLLVLILLIVLPFATPAQTGGELSEGERLFQGAWELHGLSSGNPTGTLRIDGHQFRAEVIHGDYEGTIAVRHDASPAEIDFTIRNCACKFEGLTSAGIYYEEDGAFVLALPAPGEPRPESFSGLDETKLMIERATKAP